MNRKIEKMLNVAKEKGYITECDKSRIITMANSEKIKSSDIEKLLAGINVRASRKAEFNKDLLPELVSFAEAIDWVKRHKQPIEIYPYGGKTPFPFSVEIKNANLLLTGNEQKENPSQYILTENKWKKFCDYVKKHPNMCRGELGENFKDYGCEYQRYWPAIISISKACKTH